MPCWKIGCWVSGGVGVAGNWGEHSWNIRKGLKVLSMGGPLMLLEFENEDEAKRTLKRGTRRFKDKVLQLERWSMEAECSKAGSQAEDV